MIDFIIDDDDGSKLIPFSDRARLLSFSIKARDLRVCEIESIKKNQIIKNNFQTGKKNAKFYYYYALKKLKELASQHPNVIPKKVQREKQ